MNSWHDRRILDLFGIDLPILQAPMAGVSTPEMAIAVSAAGGLGALACAQLTVEQARKDLATIRQATKRPINVNFFCHTPPAPEPARIAAWRKLLAPYYRELGLDPDAPIPETNRVPFDDAFCALMEEAKPEVVSFHFGLPAPALLDRVRATGARIISSATTVAEARWLEERGVRRDHRHGPRGRRPSRQLPLRRHRPADGHLRAGAAGRRCGESAGHRRRRHHRRARHRRGVRARRVGRADRHGVYADAGSQADGLAPQGAAQRRRTPHPAHDSVHRPAGARHRQSADARSRRDQSGRAQLPAGGRRAPAAQGQGRGGGIGRLHQSVVRPGREPCQGNAGRQL